MNYLDRFISAFAPARGLRRVQARTALKLMERGFEGASRGRRMSGWQTGSSSANGEIGPSLVTLRDRASDLVRNMGYASNAQQVWISYVVGNGIRARAAEEDLALFKDWALVCDWDGIHDFIGIQSLIVGAVWERGECLVRIRPRRLQDGLPVPFQIQVLEADHLDHTKNADVKGSGRIVHGVETDKAGRRIAYWIFPDHPGDGFSAGRGMQKSKRVPAGEILHIFEQMRPGQVRGLPALTNNLIRARDMDDYEDAERVRKKIEACYAGFVTSPDGDQGNPLKGSKAGDNGEVQHMLEPGYIARLKPGEDIKFAEPTSRGGTEYLAYLRNQLQGFSAGNHLPYGAVTGDLSQANYSSMRAGEIPTRRRVRRFQKNVLIFQFCRPIWAALSHYSELAGVRTQMPRASWVPDKFDPIDPLKEMMTDILAIRAGLKTLDQVITERGGDREEWLSQIENINKILDEKGIVLDVDPRKIAKSGAFQSGIDLAQTE